jgi:hypothetical protein
MEIVNAKSADSDYATGVLFQRGIVLMPSSTKRLT